MTPPAAMPLARDLALAGLDFARNCTRNLLRGVPDEMALYQLAEGDPHAMWIAGHLAVSDEWIEGMIAPFESRLPADYRVLFGHRSTPTASAAAYPSFRDVIRHMETARTRLIETVQNAENEQLLRPLGDAGVGFAHDPLDAVNKIAWHEGWHGGQLSRIRHSLGLPRVFPD